MGKRPAPRKKPPVPSARTRPVRGIKAQIAGEIYTALERLGADEELLDIVGSWRDTLDDAAVLSLLRDWNAGRPILHRPQ